MRPDTETDNDSNGESDYDFATKINFDDCQPPQRKKSSKKSTDTKIPLPNIKPGDTVKFSLNSDDSNSPTVTIKTPTEQQLVQINNVFGPLVEASKEQIINWYDGLISTVETVSPEFKPMTDDIRQAFHEFCEEPNDDDETTYEEDELLTEEERLQKIMDRINDQEQTSQSNNQKDDQSTAKTVQHKLSHTASAHKYMERIHQIRENFFQSAIEKADNPAKKEKITRLNDMFVNFSEKIDNIDNDWSVYWSTFQSILTGNKPQLNESTNRTKNLRRRSPLISADAVELTE